MKLATSPLRQGWLMATAVLVLACVGVWSVNQAGADEPKAEFVSLFNGKDLDGWVQPAADSGGTFTAENGEIVGRTNGKLKKNEFLVTSKPYANYILKAKIKIRNGNSGIQFRSERKPDGAVAGPQADVADGYWGLLYEERQRGILDKDSIEKAKKIVKPDDFNEYVIKAQGKHVVITLNGEKMIDRTDEKFADSGIIALQIHVGPAMEVRFKDLSIQELK